uniref:Quinate permease n=1 Tax=Colletotrichum fructicola (strain Nara gc5) TaxID=1213859 RepID=L2GAC4_COLFN
MGFFSTHAAGTLDPPEVRNWRIHLIALVASMSALAMGYDTAVIGGTMALDSFRRDFHLDEVSTTARDTIQGNIVSTFQAGCFFGALLTFPISAAAKPSCSPAPSSSSTAPPSIRGRLVGIFEIASQGGGMLGFWINYATDRTINVNNHAQWVVPLGIQLVPGLGLALGMIWCPESPRWLARGDHFDAAERILVKLRGLPADHEYIRREMNDIRTQVEQRTNNRLTKKQMFQKLFQKGIRNRMGLGMALMFLQSFTGVNIITYYAPRIFESLGITGTSTKLFSTGFYGIAKTFGMFLFTFWVAERVGRRKGLIWGSALGCIPMWYIGGYVMRADPAARAAAGVIIRDGWSYLAMVCVYINGVIICATWQGITWLYASEVQTLEIRMLAVSITTATTWLGSFIIARSTPYMISDLGYGAYFFFSSILMLMGIWAFFFVPETKGLTLEDMDALFMQPTHKTVWVQMRGRDVVTAGRARSPSITDEKLEANIEAAQIEERTKS